MGPGLCRFAQPIDRFFIAQKLPDTIDYALILPRQVSSLINTSSMRQTANSVS